MPAAHGRLANDGDLVSVDLRLMLPDEVCKLPILSVELNDAYSVLDFLWKHTNLISNIKNIKRHTF